MCATTAVLRRALLGAGILALRAAGFVPGGVVRPSHVEIPRAVSEMPSRGRPGAQQATTPSMAAAPADGDSNSISRRSMLGASGLAVAAQILGKPATALADDDDADEAEDDGGEAEAPGSVPRDVTFKVKDDVCDKHPTWKQCKNRVQGGGATADKNLKAPEVKLDNGLTIKDLVVGKGNTPKQGDMCTMHYSLYYNGAEIESSRESSGLAASPVGFQFGAKAGGPGSLIPALALGVDGMKVGGVRRITAPPELAFGNAGRAGGRVPPGATVQFDMQLLSVKRRGTNPLTRQGKGSEVNTGLFDLF